MAWSVNPQFGRINWQDDFICTFDTDGGITAKQSFLIMREELGATKPAKGTSCNETGFESLQLKNFTVSYDKGPYYKVSCTFAASATTYNGGGGSAEFGETYHTSVTTVLEPIETHIKFKNFTTTDWQKVALYKAKKIVRDPSDVTKLLEKKINFTTNKEFTEVITMPDTSNFDLLLKWIDGGIVNYKSPQIQYKHRWQSRNKISSSALNKVGKKDSPSGQPPSLNNERDWILLGSNSDVDDGVYQNEMVWQSSGAGGLVDEVYE